MGCLLSSSNNVVIDKQNSNLPYTVNNTNIYNKLTFKEGLFIQTFKENPFNYYSQLAKIGSGSFGTVYKVLKKDTNKIRAMKCIELKNYSCDLMSPNISKRAKTLLCNYLNEIKLVKNIDHPNICKIYEIFEYENKINIIYEICNGGELFDYIKKNYIVSENTAVYIMKQIFSAVNYYQSLGIVHRDLKPENILIENKEDAVKGKINCKLIDFGLAFLNSVECESNTYNNNSKKYKEKNSNIKLNIKGSLSYLAPECFDNEYSYKSDIWAAGVIFYFLVQGRLPFVANTSEDLIDKIKSGKFTYKIKISKEAEDLINKCLTADKKKRISSVDKILQHDLFKSTNRTLLDDYSYRTIENKSTNEYPVETILKRVKKNINIEKKLQKLVIAFIVKFIEDDPETIKLKELFSYIDNNGDGRITTKELSDYFYKSYSSNNNLNISKDNFDKEMMLVLNHMDSDNSGTIEREEFLRACCDLETVLTDINITRVYNTFDRDKDGRISSSDIAIIFKGNSDVDFKDCEDMMKEVDLNNDGILSLSEFKVMMNDLLKIK